MSLEVGSVLALIAWQNVLAGAVSVSGVGCEAIVEEVLSFELEVISVG